MKRAASVILLCLLTAFLLAGCGEKREKTYLMPITEAPITEVPVTEQPTKIPATEPATEAPGTEPPVTEPPVTEPPATEPPATEAPATEPPATEPPATEPPSALSAVAAHYAEYLRTHSDVLDMTQHYDSFHYDDCAAYRNVAFLDVTGDGIPEMLLICYDPDSTNQIMCFRIITADESGAREIRKPNGDKIMNLFWDQTFVHDMTDTVLFTRGSTLYFYRKTAGGERDYSFESEEIGRLTLQAETGSLYWEIALYWEDKRTPAGTEILFQAEEKDIDEATYQAMKADLLGSADTFVLYGMPYYVPVPAYTEVHEDLSDYIAMTPAEARGFLESVSEVPFTEPSTTEARTGLSAAADLYADYIRSHRDDLDVQEQPGIYSSEPGTYPNVAFYDLTGDGVPEMLLICYNPEKFIPILSFRVITADASGVREIRKPNGDYIMNLFWDQTLASGMVDTVLFTRDSTLYFYRRQQYDGLGGVTEEIGRMVRDAGSGSLYWEIALEYTSEYVSISQIETKYLAEEEPIDEAAYHARKNEILGSADEFILYALPGAMGSPAFQELGAPAGAYLAMTPSEALQYLEQNR